VAVTAGNDRCALEDARQAARGTPERLLAVTPDGQDRPTQGFVAEKASHLGGVRVHVMPRLRQATSKRDSVHTTPAPLTRALGRLARELIGCTVGIALGSGATKGFAHVGVLETLDQLGVSVDYIAGSSVGAVVGGLWSLGRSPDEIMRWLVGLKEQAIRFTLPFQSLLGGRGIATHARQAGQGCEFKDASVPFAAVAVDLETGGEMVFRTGPMWLPVLASSSIPGLYPPVQIAGRYYADGGIVNPVPTNVVSTLGADVVIAVPLCTRARPLQKPRAPCLTETVARALAYMQQRLNDQSVSQAACVIAPVLDGGLTTRWRGGSCASDYRNAGRAAVEAVLPRLRELLPWLS